GEAGREVPRGHLRRLRTRGNRRMGARCRARRLCVASQQPPTGDRGGRAMNTAPHSFKVGDRVTPNPNVEGVPRSMAGRVFRVRKVNPKNLACDAEDGGRGISYPPLALLPVEGEIPPATTVIGRPYEPRETFVMGEVVTLARAFKDIATDTPMIVLADKGRRINVTRLCGDG